MNNFATATAIGDLRSISVAETWNCFGERFRRQKLNKGTAVACYSAQVEGLRHGANVQSGHSFRQLRRAGGTIGRFSQPDCCVLKQVAQYRADFSLQ